MVLVLKKITQQHNGRCVSAHQLRDCQYAMDAGEKIFAKGDEEVIIKSFCHPSTTRQDGRGKTGAISQ
ncbi:MULTISPECIES: hypothetical protein [unclassified Microcoleus]|uniref:hypothetical protein n=1 Tax=unclassified Microcoleus TaxID=2642155 RepID=UPI002FD2F42C